MGPKELKSNLAKAGWIPWSAWRHSQTNICTGRGKVGGWRWECCLRQVAVPVASWWPTEDLSHFRYFQISESTFLVLRVVLIWISHGATWGWGCSFWGCVQARPAGTQECATLALLIYRPQWFTVIDVHIPECQNSLCFERNQWLRLWFYLRPFPDKRLNCAWSWENTVGEHRSVLASVCAQGLGKGHFCVGLTFTSLGPGGLCAEHHSLVRSGSLRSKDSSVPVLLQSIPAQPWSGSMVFSVWQHLEAQFQGALQSDKSLCFRLFWLQNRGEAAYSWCFQNWKYFTS